MDISEAYAECGADTFLCPSDEILSAKSGVQLFTDFTNRKGSDIRMFEQDRWMITNGGDAVLITQMSDRQLISLKELFDHQADYFKDSWVSYIKALSKVSKDIKSRGGIYDIEAIEHESGSDWIRSTPLYRKIERLSVMSSSFLMN